MIILVTNDDGIDAVGIQKLATMAKNLGEVWVVAPDKQCSAMSQRIHVRGELIVQRRKDFPVEGVQAFSVSGTPADCVKVALMEILPQKPDIVFSGINIGYNVGQDILYSGTVSCAMEGAMMGYPAMAVSLASMSSEPELFANVAKFIGKFIHKIEDYKFPPKTILNVNVPGLMPEDLAGVAITKLGGKMFTDEYDKRVDPRGKVYYWMAGELIRHCDNDDSDINALRWNKVSITPITFEMTEASVIPELEAKLCKEDITSWT